MLFTVSMLLSGCARVVVQPLLNPLTRSLERQTDLELLRDGGPSLLLMLDGLIENDPGGTQILIAGTRAYASYAAVMFADGQVERAVRYSEKSKEYGQALLNLYSHYRENARAPLADFTRALSDFGKGDVAPLFWGGYGWAIWARYQSGAPAAMVELPRIEQIMLRVVELDESFYYGAAHVVLGSYYGSRPEMLGGDLEKSRQHFERSLKIAGRRFLLTQVAYAETYARMTFDRELFERLLTEVINHSSVKNELSASNRLAQTEAEKLLARTDDFF